MGEKDTRCRQAGPPAKLIKVNTTKITAAIKKVFFVKKNKLNVSTF